MLANGGKLAPFTNGAGKSFCALLRGSFFASFEIGTHHHWPQHMCEIMDFAKLNEQLASVHPFWSTISGNSGVDFECAVEAPPLETKTIVQSVA